MCGYAVLRPSPAAPPARLTAWLAGLAAPGELEQLEQLCRMVKATSLCGLGQAAPNPVLSALRHFRPEFLNRIDEVIRFRPLDRGDLQRIVRLQLAELTGLLAEQQLRLEVSEPVVQMLVSQGYEPEYGARPLRRVLRRRIENPLATALLAESFSGASAVRVELGNDQDPQLRFLAIP
jgi:hypothetical protein